MKKQVIKNGMLTGLMVLSLSLFTAAQDYYQNDYTGGTYCFYNGGSEDILSGSDTYQYNVGDSEKESTTSADESNTSRWGFEFNLGGSFATRDLAGASLNTGMGFEGIFNYRFLPHTGLYAGWGWNKFSADNSFAGSHMDFEETGYVYGIHFKHPLKGTKLSYYLRAGGLYNHIELENEDGNIIGDTGHGTGWQVAGGVELALSKKWNFTPGFKYNSLSRDVKFEGTTYSLQQDYFSLRIGFLRNF
jgi:opacity protein-like surface antigen